MLLGFSSEQSKLENTEREPGFELLTFCDGGDHFTNQYLCHSRSMRPEAYSLKKKQASRPILVRGLRQDLRYYFLLQNVKVSVAQLVE